MKAYKGTHKYLQDHKADIIKQYQNKVSVKNIAQQYGVYPVSIYWNLKKWGAYRRVYKKANSFIYMMATKNLNPNLKAQQKVNSIYNDQHIRRVSAGDSPEDQRLISAMLQMVIRG
jgi:transposase-like protein